jgi:hypothetical protein
MKFRRIYQAGILLRRLVTKFGSGLVLSCAPDMSQVLYSLLASVTPHIGLDTNAK